MKPTIPVNKKSGWVLWDLSQRTRSLSQRTRSIWDLSQRKRSLWDLSQRTRSLSQRTKSLWDLSQRTRSLWDMPQRTTMAAKAVRSKHNTRVIDLQVAALILLMPACTLSITRTCCKKDPKTQFAMQVPFVNTSKACTFQRSKNRQLHRNHKLHH